MALRQEDLQAGPSAASRAQVVSFPTAAVRRRAARQRRVIFLRRRLVVAAAAVCAAVALGSAFGAASSPVSSAEGAPRSVRLQPGETVWGLAAVYAPGEDPRAYVDAVLRLNDLSGAPAVGTKIRLPRG